MLTCFVAGLDLGPATEHSGLALLQTSSMRGPSSYAVRHLQRWSPGTPYREIAADVRTLLQQEELTACPLVMDRTGVGRAVVDLFKQCSPLVRPVVVSAGHSVSCGEDGLLHVPKQELVATLQVLLQGRRLQVAASLSLAETLTREMVNFRTKVVLAGAEAPVAWREREHDDLVLSVALAAWQAERTPAPAGEPMALDSPRAGLPWRSA
jgi:predicted RNase H-like nuclease